MRYSWRRMGLCGLAYRLIVVLVSSQLECFVWSVLLVA
jgi:hypothetical protein